MKYQPVIGLEVHVQLKTNTKIFCGCSTQFGASPNSQTCPVCLGLPGALPVLNRKVVEFAIKAGLATNCRIAPRSVFARKNYFYPDLPKGYQISQYELPICEHGHLDIAGDWGTKTIGITRIHMEEDAGKLVHSDIPGLGSGSGVDLNRACTPLLEIVSEPDIRTADEAVAYLKKLHQIVVYLGICDGNMEEGSFRCDANVSVMPVGSDRFGTRTETKNVNSFRFVKQAIEYEIERQIEVIEDGGTIVQETRLFDPTTGETRSMRGKEDAHDYRYFPDPDLVPLVISNDWVDEVRLALPELPDVKKQAYVEELLLPEYDADVITSKSDQIDSFEKALIAFCLKASADSSKNKITNYINDIGFASILKSQNLKHIMEESFKNLASVVPEFNKRFMSHKKESPNATLLSYSAKIASNWVMGKEKIAPDYLADIMLMVEKGTISSNIAKSVFETVVKTGKEPAQIVEEQGLVQVSDTGEIERIIDEIMVANMGQVEEYRGGKEKVFGFFVGQVMRASKGKANPAVVNDLLLTKLKG